MKCRKCKAEISDDFLFCPICGTKQTAQQKTKSRGNGTGSVYQLPNKTWIAVRVLGYKIGADGKKHKDTVSKSGFKTKREAINYLPQLTQQERKFKSVTMQTLYDTWEPTHKTSKSTLNCYRAAWKYFRPVWLLQVAEVDVDDLQSCLDECPKGKRTKENMKALCGLLYKYAIPRHLAGLNLGEYLRTGGGETSEKDALPMDAVEKLQAAIGRVPYADYIVAQCYLGFRPSELLALDAKNYDRKHKAFVGGAKTEAGKDRTVTISPKIQPIVDRLTKDKLSGPVFCDEGGKSMDIKTYRAAFYAALDAVGVENPITVVDGVNRRKYTPHSCRHTFATLMKAVDAPDKDKLKLIGHTSTEMLRHYQDVDIESLKKITDAL
ncbi:MAG: tyrosine-type recombinase/integrase [Oscillospiraceae bacterium]|nr:tyrosine-type recombinase/integrase [Oscillospiraceae bacterium]